MTLPVDRADNFLNQDGECLIVTSLGDIIIFPRREKVTRSADGGIAAFE